MKDRLSIARACNAGDAAESLGAGLGMVMAASVTGNLRIIKYFT
jgi:hypothetical protein